MAQSVQPTASLRARLAAFGARISGHWHQEIWSPARLRDRTPRGWLFAVLRVISITSTVFIESRVPARAAALTFSSLLGFGPLVAICVLIGGFVLGNNSDPNLVANKLGAIVQDIAPQLRQLDLLNAQEHGAEIGRAHV